MWAALDRRKSHNSIMRCSVPLPGLLQTFLCILNFLALAGKTVKNGMKAKTTVNYSTTKKVKSIVLECENHYIHTDNFSRLIELKIGLVEPNLIWFHKYDNIQSTAFH